MDLQSTPAQRDYGVLLRVYGADELRRDGYPVAWPDISRMVRERAFKCCAWCGRPNDPAHGYTLTVHHWNGVTADCREENLSALCQRHHLQFQGMGYRRMPPHVKQLELFPVSSVVPCRASE